MSTTGIALVFTITIGRATRGNEVLISLTDRQVGSRVTAILDGICYHGETEDAAVEIA